MVTAALVGNPNVGKTTLFNYLTGSNQYVGNWAGVTVEKKEGLLNKDIKIVDLPGIYAMDTFSNEEKVSKQFLEDENTDLIINIVDASNLDRNLYLTTQLKQFGKPIILVLNMLDVAHSKGLNIDTKKLSLNLGVTIVSMSKNKEDKISELKNLLINKNYFSEIDERNYNFESEKKTYAYIESILEECIETSKDNKRNVTEFLDSIILNKFLAYPIFLFLMFLIFKFTFNWVGQPLSDGIAYIIDDLFVPFIENLLSSSDDWFKSLIIDGIIGGVGSVISLLPYILTLFFGISILEDSGYMARTAFIMDKIMRKIGLSGKAFIPMIVGFGCSVPAIMSARTLESEKDRKLTALLVPLMSCNARIPVYALFATIFFKGRETSMVISLYVLGVLVAFIIGLLFKNTLFKKDEEPFIIELPSYKSPELKSLLMHTWEKGKGFLQKAGTIIFSVSVVVWLLSNFSFSGMVTIEDSLLASFGKLLVPIFKPLGFANWQNAVALLTGLMAKEVVVSTLGVLYGNNLTEILPSIFTTASAYSYLVFILLYTPCVSTIAVMQKEYGNKMAIFSVFYQLILAWIGSFIVYNLITLFL
ncbi:ferrous iron transport protein B [Clostridium grantii]|uniref:Ferrous iron transport protein B n=1 Tax=Clostridium grantii DSM 8605 TaxID=1121316 RepID=A0A1M5QPW4_9CLOT|nr:ferrous iron transport protein B [Clostridium grantii]SHH16144.1 ferrous iron transport protein B [Clostridium grantii DSM 8605]